LESIQSHSPGLYTPYTKHTLPCFSLCQVTHYRWPRPLIQSHR